MDYAKKMDMILRLLGIRTQDPIINKESRVKKSASDYPGFRSAQDKLVRDSFIPYLYSWYRKLNNFFD